METVFLVCAVAGGVVMLCQFALSILGLSGEHDVDGDHGFDFGDHADLADHDFTGDHEVDLGDHGDAVDQDVGAEHGANVFFQMLSLRSVVAALTFFGLGGLVASTSSAFSVFSFPVAVFSGAVAMIVVAWMMRLLHTLHAEGNVRIQNAVGAMGTIYLTVPSHGKGAGKVTVETQGRTMEYRAVTAGDKPLKTGTGVVVVGLAGPDTVEVGPAPED